jgi:LacI family transcriptional regulator
MTWLRRLGKQIPRDVGFAMVNWGPDRDCAGVDQNNRAVGAAAVDLVVGQLYRNECGIPEVAKVVQVESRWVDGPTVRKVSAEAGRLRSLRS